MARPPSDLTKFIRSLPKNLSVAEVIAKAKAAGHATSGAYVARVRGGGATAARETGRTKPASKKPGKQAARAQKAAAAKRVTTPTTTTAPGTARSAGVSKSEFIRLHPSLSTAEVIAAGKDQGLTFTANLVYAVRGPKGGKTTPKTATSRAPARKGGRTASKADFVRERGHLSPKEIVEDAKSKGVKLNASYVYNVRGYDKALASKQTRAARKSATTTPAVASTAPKASRPSSPASSVEDLLKAVAAELGLGRAIEILQGERARVRAVIGG
jgi:hypothetical protein